MQSKDRRPACPSGRFSPAHGYIYCLDLCNPTEYAVTWGVPVCDEPLYLEPVVGCTMVRGVRGDENLLAGIYCCPCQ